MVGSSGNLEVMRLAVACGLGVLCACGRVGYEPRTQPIDAGADAGLDASLDASLDAKVDAPVVPVCPLGTTELAPGSPTCIEKDQRGSDTWTNAVADCANLGRRLCADAEWFEGCTSAAGLTGMFDDYEWVAEEAGGVALKRGPDACDGMSSHEIFIDPYGYRCCVAKS